MTKLGRSLNCSKSPSKSNSCSGETNDTREVILPYGVQSHWCQSRSYLHTTQFDVKPVDASTPCRRCAQTFSQFISLYMSTSLRPMSTMSIWKLWNDLIERLSCVSGMPNAHQREPRGLAPGEFPSLSRECSTKLLLEGSKSSITVRRTQFALLPGMLWRATQ
jgi:hypothetical protein